MNLDVVPVREGLRDLGVRRLVGHSQVLKRRIGEDDAPAEGIERTIAFQNAYLPRGKAPLDQNAEVETGRPPPMQVTRIFRVVTCLQFY